MREKASSLCSAGGTKGPWPRGYMTPLRCTKFSENSEIISECSDISKISEAMPCCKLTLFVARCRAAVSFPRRKWSTTHANLANIDRIGCGKLELPLLSHASESKMMKPLPVRRRWLLVLVAAAIVYLTLAYLVLPTLWTHHEHEPGLASLPMVIRASSGIPGDALNVGLVGSKEDVLRAMHAASWFPVDPITLRASIEIVGSVVLDRPTTMRLSALFSMKVRRNNSLSRSRMARVPTSDITCGCGRSSKKAPMAVRSGSVRSRSTAGSA